MASNSLLFPLNFSTGYFKVLLHLTNVNCMQSSVRELYIRDIAGIRSEIVGACAVPRAATSSSQGVSQEVPFQG